MSSMPEARIGKWKAESVPDMPIAPFAFGLIQSLICRIANFNRVAILRKAGNAPAEAHLKLIPAFSLLTNIGKRLADFIQNLDGLCAISVKQDNGQFIASVFMAASCLSKSVSVER